MAVIQAKNCNRSYAAKNKSMSMDFISDVIDFHDMPMGSIQIIWSGVAGALDCSFKLYASNLPEVSSFDIDGTEIDGSEIIPHNNDGCRIWIRDRIGFRYVMIRYTKNGTTDGSVDILAYGKKS